MYRRTFLAALVLLLAWPAVPAVAQITTGIWWSASEAGRGYVVEVSGSRALVAVLGYRSGGTASWYLSSGSLFTSSVFNNDLAELGGGQTLSGAAKAPTASTSLGNISISASSSTTASVVLPGGREIAIQRYEFIGGGIAGGRAAAAPETGWWWNALEAGRGYFIEVQGGRLFVAAMMYESDGTSRWYVATGDLIIGPFGLSPTMTASLEEYAGGPTLTGGYTTPSRSAVKGQITLTFSSTTAGVLTLPNGTAVALTRFVGF
jgi:hypothetical protein